MPPINEQIANINESVAAVNQAAGGLGIDSDLNALAKPAETITAADLDGQPDIDLTPGEAPVDAPAVDEFQQDQKVAATVRKEQSGLLAEVNQSKAETAAATDSSFDNYLNQILSSPTFSELQVEEYKKAGVDEGQLRVDQLDTQMLAEQDALRSKIENLRNRGGGLEGSIEGDVASAERASISKQADIALLQLAAQDQLDYATRVADRAVNAQFERQERIESVRKEIYERNKDLFDRDEQRAFEIALNDRERTLNAEKEEEKLKRSTQIEALKMAQLNNAPQSVVDAIMSAASPEEVYQLGGQYVAVDMLERQVKNQQLANAINAGRIQDYEIAQISAAEERRNEAIEAGELLPEQFDVVDEFDSDFRSEPLVKEFNEAAGKRFAFEQIVNGGETLGIQDIFLVYEFMKSVDPTSVVRESEFATAAEAGNIFEGTYAKYNGYFSEGQRLPVEVREGFVNAANSAWSGKQSQYFNVKEEFGAKINRQLGIENGANYLTSYEDAAPLNQATSIENAKTNEVVVKDGIKYIKQSDGTFKQLTD